MIIGVNLLPIRKNLTGVGVYAYNILREISELDSKNKYLLLMNSEIYETLKIDKLNFKIIKIPVKANTVFLRIFWEQMILPIFIKIHKVDVLFSPSVVMPIFSKCKNIICIHDLTPFHSENKFSKLRTFYVKLMTKLSAKKADRILTVSQNSKKELQNFCDINSDKIIVTYNSINNQIINPDIKLWNSFKEKYRIPDDYILYVGTLEPGKNIVNLIKAFNILKKENSIKSKLVIAGGKGWLYDLIFSLIEDHQIKNDVIFTDYVQNDVLGLLYKNASLFVFPSFNEGFGIPVLEAMSFGIPVITSKLSSLPEVAGNAGIYIDPHDENDIARAISKIIMNRELRKVMIDRGFKQAKRFSWQKSARITLSEINKLFIK